LYQGTASAVPQKRTRNERRAFRPGKGVNKLQFQIKGQDFFLAFVEQEKRWYVFSPTPQGVNRIPVYVDAVKYERTGILDLNTSLSS